MSAFERLWARIANYSNRSGKRYVMMARTAWGERTIFPFNGPNSIEFTGYLVQGKIPLVDDRMLVTVGFYHPIFSGAIPKYGVVEVIPNLASRTPVKYVAKGRGIHSLWVMPQCDNVDYVQPENPCDVPVCVDNNFRWVWGPPGVSADDPSGYGIYDRATRQDEIKENELPGIVKVPGSSDDDPLPVTTRGYLSAWIPGECSFYPTFQPCKTPSSGFANGIVDGTPWCCTLLEYLTGAFGQEIQQFFQDNLELWAYCEDFWNGDTGVKPF